MSEIIPVTKLQKMTKRKMLARKYGMFLLREIHDGNQRLQNFFKDLDDSLQVVVQEEETECMNEIKKNIQRVKALVDEKNSLESKMKNAGISFDVPMEYTLKLGYYEADGVKNKSFNVFQQFNGCILNKEMLTEEGLQKLIEEYEASLRVNASCDQKRAELEKRIKEKEKKSRSIFLSRDSKNNLMAEIEACKEELETVDSNRRDSEKIKKLIDAIARLSPEQKRLIITYLTTTSELQSLTRTVETINRTILDGKILSGKNKLVSETHLDNGSLIMQKAFFRMVKDKGLSEADIMDIHYMINELEAKYDDSKHPNSIANIQEVAGNNYERLVEPFFTYIYEPEKSLEEQEYLGSVVKKLREEAGAGDEEVTRVPDEKE